MLKKTFTYTDYNGNQRQEEHYFNLSKAEAMEMELTTPGGLKQTLRKLTEQQNTPELFRIFKNIILGAYGEKSADGRQFIKSQEMSEAFSQTEMYSQLFMELVSSAKNTAEFVKGILPADVVPQVEAELVKQGITDNSIERASATIVNMPVQE